MKQLITLLLLIMTVVTQAQIKFPDKLEHYDSNQYLIDQNQKKGGYWVVNNVTERNAIPEAKRLIGMFVTWYDTGEAFTKRYSGINVTDTEWTNDDNWVSLTVVEEVTVDSIQFNTVTKTDFEDGTLYYDDLTRSMVFQNDIADFSHNLGYELVTRVYNNTTDSIKNGRVVRIVGNYKDNGNITPLIKLAGNSSIDSTLVIGLATVDIPPNSYGIALLAGEAKGLNTTFCENDSCIIYLGSGGTLIDTVPEAPNFAVRLGQVYYADADSGRVFFNPNAARYSPDPHVAGDTARYNQTLLIDKNVFDYIPISAMYINDEIGFQLIGDSILCLVDAHITVAFNMSYIGNAQSDLWRIGGFLNGIEQNSVSRSTSSTSVGNSTLIYTSDIVVGDYISFKMTNESASRDPIISDMSFEIIYISE